MLPPHGSAHDDATPHTSPEQKPDGHAVADVALPAPLQVRSVPPEQVVEPGWQSGQHESESRQPPAAQGWAVSFVPEESQV